LNQCFLIALDFESMFRAGMVKILLQQYPPKSGLIHHNKIAPGGVGTHSRHGEMVRLARFQLATFAVSRRRSPAEFKGAVWFAGNSPDMN
jgi:hypothetical protein